MMKKYKYHNLVRKLNEKKTKLFYDIMHKK